MGRLRILGGSHLKSVRACSTWFGEINRRFHGSGGQERGHICQRFIRSECGCQEFPKDFAGICLDYACGPRLMELLDYLERRAPVRGKAILRQLTRALPPHSQPRSPALLFLTRHQSAFLLSREAATGVDVALLRIAGGV